jgi:hypothetical protein
MDQGLENHRILYMERQINEGEHKIESLIFRLVIPYVSVLISQTGIYGINK